MYMISIYVLQTVSIQLNDPFHKRYKKTYLTVHFKKKNIKTCKIRLFYCYKQYWVYDLFVVVFFCFYAFHDCNAPAYNLPESSHFAIVFDNLCVAPNCSSEDVNAFIVLLFSGNIWMALYIYIKYRPKLDTMLLFILSEQFGRFLFAFFSAYQNLDTVGSKYRLKWERDTQMIINGRTGQENEKQRNRKRD